MRGNEGFKKVANEVKGTRCRIIVQFVNIISYFCCDFRFRLAIHMWFLAMSCGGVVDF